MPFIYSSRKCKLIYSDRSRSVLAYDYTTTIQPAPEVGNLVLPLSPASPSHSLSHDSVARSNRFYLFNVVHNHLFLSIIMVTLLGQGFKHLIYTLFLVASNLSLYLYFLPVLIYPLYCCQRNY